VVVAGAARTAAGASSADSSPAAAADTLGVAADSPDVAADTRAEDPAGRHMVELGPRAAASRAPQVPTAETFFVLA